MGSCFMKATCFLLQILEQRRPLPPGPSEFESGQHQMDGSPEKKSGGNLSSSGQDERKPSPEKKASSNNKMPSDHEEYKIAVCDPVSAVEKVARFSV